MAETTSPPVEQFGSVSILLQKTEMAPNLPKYVANPARMLK